MFIIEEKIMWNKAEFYIHVFNNVKIPGLSFG